MRVYKDKLWWCPEGEEQLITERDAGAWVVERLGKCLVHRPLKAGRGAER